MIHLQNDWFEYQIRNVHGQIRDDWKLLRDKEECNIMEQNVHIGHIITHLAFCKWHKYLVIELKKKVSKTRFDN